MHARCCQSEGPRYLGKVVRGTWQWQPLLSDIRITFSSCRSHTHRHVTLNLCPKLHWSKCSPLIVHFLTGFVYVYIYIYVPFPQNKLPTTSYQTGFCCCKADLIIFVAGYRVFLLLWLWVLHGACCRGREVMQWHDHTIALQFYTGGGLRPAFYDVLLVSWPASSLWIRWFGGALLHCNCITGGWTRRDSTLSVSLSPADINTAAPPPAPAARGTLQR